MLDTSNFQLTFFGRQNTLLFRNFCIESYLMKSFVNHDDRSDSSQYKAIPPISATQELESQSLGMANTYPKSIKQARSQFENNVEDLIDFTPIILHEINLDFVQTLVDCAQCQETLPTALTNSNTYSKVNNDNVDVNTNDKINSSKNNEHLSVDIGSDLATIYMYSLRSVTMAIIVLEFIYI